MIGGMKLAVVAIFWASQINAETINVAISAGYYPPNLFSEFETSTGISVDLLEISSNEELIGKMIASNGDGFDLIVASSPYLTAMRNMGMIADINHAKIPNISNLYPEAFELAYDVGLKFSVPYTWVTTGLCYVSDRLSFTPDSWLDVLTPKDEVIGRYTLIPDERWFLQTAQLAKGYSPNDVSTTALDDIRPLLISGRKHLLTFDAFTMGQRLLSEEALLAVAFDGQCNQAIKENAAIKWVIPKEGTDLIIDAMAVASKSKSPDAALALINFILQPEQQSWVMSDLLYNTPNRVAKELLDPKQLEKFDALRADPSELLKYEIHTDLNEEATRVSQYITEIMNSN